MSIDFYAFLDSLKYMGYGMFGIFAITGIIILVVQLLKKIFSAKAK